MGSWKCTICEKEERYPSKSQVKEHVRERHIETLVIASIQRSSDEPNVSLDYDLTGA